MLVGCLSFFLGLLLSLFVFNFIFFAMSMARTVTKVSEYFFGLQHPAM